MSSRALRKAQRERDEQERLNANNSVEREDEADDNYISHTQPKKSAFALLEEEEEEEEQEEGEHDESGSNDTKKPEPAPQLSNKKRKKKKKAARNRASAEQEQRKEDDDLDEIDIALKQLSTRSDPDQSAATVVGVDPDVEQANKLLSIDTNHLHAQNEMRRLFGRAALDEQDDDQQAAPAAVGGNRRQQRRVQQVGLAQALRGQRQGGRAGAFSTIALRRNIFIQGKEEWPSATTGGLSMDIEEKRPDGTVLYRFVRNNAYQDLQSQFESCVESMDPNRMVVLLQHNPYHISTLLQVSEIAKAERDHATSGDLLERALFSFGRAVHSTFSRNLSEGKARLDFRRAENRELWLASWRYMQNLSMRATWRTVYEWAKMLLSLSPDDDPYALWFVLDQYALRSRQDLDYLNLSRAHQLAATHRGAPNVQLSQALAEIRAGNKNKGKQALFTAIGRYPWIVARLLQELNLDAPPAVWGTEPRNEAEKLYCELYVTRARDLWNTPETSSLLLEIASAVPREAKAAPIDEAEIAQNVARHVLLSDNPSLIALVPRKYTAQLTSASDPIPPDDAFMSSLQRQHGNPTAREATVHESLEELRGLQRFFAQAFPWYGRTGPRADGGAGNDDNDDDEGVNDDGAEHHPRPNDEEIIRQLQETGLSPEEIERRAHRMVDIEDSLRDRFPGLDAGQVERIIREVQPPPEAGESDSRDPRLARVEDAPDEELG